MIVSDRVSCAEVLSDQVCTHFKHNNLTSLKKVISQIVYETTKVPTVPLTKERIDSELRAHLSNPLEHVKALLSL